MQLRRTIAIVLLFLLALIGPSTSAQQPVRSDTVEQQMIEAFDKGDYARATAVIEKHLAEHPGDATMLYNLACARCMMEDYDASAQALLRAFKAGFKDLEHLRVDPDLKGLREHPTYKAILEKADDAARDRMKTSVEQWRETYGTDNYRYETDTEHKLHFATALDETSHKDVREMLAKEADLLTKLLFEEPPRSYILIAVPTPEDSDAFFKNNDSIGGIYEHSPRRLVARDIGSSLRHEFVHAYHFGHMERIRQMHPLWVQEGLASLFEDYEIDADGSVRFLPNDRQLIIKSRARGGRLIKWEEVMGLNGEQFMDRAGKLYPQVRSMFEFIADRGKLTEWYESYVETYKEDRTGAKAFEAVFGEPVEDIERAWRKWLVEQPEVDLQIGANDAALGIQSGENLSNDGVLVTGVVPGSAASRSRMRKGDVIVALDGKPTRTMVELRRLVAAKNVGDEVTVRLRRNGEYLEATLVLRPLYADN